MNVTKILAALTLGAGLAGAVYACSGPQQTTTQMSSSSLVPAAEGSIQAQKGENQNTELTVTVRHLSHPAKLAAGATTYVVWLQANGQTAPQNIGALDIDKGLTGTLKTTTPHAEFQLSITAEPFPKAPAPTGPEVFRTTVRSK